MRTGFTERKGRIEELDRSFDLKFWKAQKDSDKFAAAWELVVHSFIISRRVEADFDGIPIPFISKQDLITAKLASGASA